MRVGDGDFLLLLATFGNPRGGCVRCGYDIRATPERCPECGTVVGHAAG